MKNNVHCKKWIIHFSADDWWTQNIQSRHHLVKEFYIKGYNILWVNPMGLRFPSVKKWGFRKKISKKIKSILKGLRKHDDGFYILSFTFLPVYKRGFLEKINKALILAQLKIAMHFLGIREAISLATLPTFAPVIRSLKKSGRLIPVIYYYTDQYDQYREIRDRRPIVEWDRMLREDALSIYCASEPIFNNISREFKKKKVVKVLEHQVEFELFDYQRIVKQNLPVKKPIIGYFGSLTDSNDWDIIRYVAQRRPEWNFVFIGHKRIDLPDLEKMQNIHFLGYVPYAELPMIAINFSVGIMFWKMTEWIKACSPLKLKEYLALGLPVVSVPIDEVVNKYSQYVVIASDGPGFETAIKNSLNNHDREERNKFASQFSWSFAVDEIMHDCNI